MDIDILRAFAHEFREALDVVVDKKSYGRLHIFESFPKGCCQYSSDLLATYFINNGVPKEHIQIIKSKTRRNDYPHCWLMIDDTYFVDITADQFSGKICFEQYEPIPNCCIVPRDTSFYKLFEKNETQCLRNVGIDTYDGNISQQLKAIFDAVIQQIENKRR